MTCPFIGNEASRLSYLTGLLTKLPGNHIPLLKSYCLASKSVEEAFVIVLAYLNPATADPIRRCLCSPLGYLCLCYIVALNKHHVFTAHFEEQPHIQEEANKLQRIFCLSFSFKLTDSVVTDKPSQPYSAKQTEVSGGQAGINSWSELIQKYFIFFCWIWWDHLMWLCVSEAVCL